MTATALPFTPGNYQVVHPLESLEFVMLPATGRYVPDSTFRPVLESVDGQTYWATIVDEQGQVVASVTGSGHGLPRVDLTESSGAFVTACGRMPDLGVCAPGAATETVVQHLVAEEILSRWCEQHCGSALVWATVAGGQGGRWQIESGLAADCGADVAMLCDTRPDAAWVWRGGTRVLARRHETRVHHADRIDRRPWPNTRM